MFEILLTGISTILVIDVVSLVLNKLKTNQAKHQTSIDEFEVRLDPIIGVICLISAAFFGFCAIGASTAPVENGHYMWIAFALIAVISAILVFLFFTNVKVKGNNITYKRYLFPKIVHCTFSEITHYSIFADTITLYYANNKKVFSIDKDMIGSQNLIERLNKENIVCSEDGRTKRTIKKSDIIFRNGNVIACGIIFAIIGIIFAIPVIAEKAAEDALLTGIGDAIGFMIVMLGVFIFSMSFIVVPALINIRKIEKGLGINFDDEMAKEGITSFHFKNERWYLDDVGVVINRDYIKSIENIVFHEGNSEYNQRHYYVYHLRTIDGKIMKVKTPDDYCIKKWYKEKNY